MGGDVREHLIRAARDLLRQGEATLDLLTVVEHAGKSRSELGDAFGSAEGSSGVEALRGAVAASGFEDLAKELESASDQASDPEEGLRGVAQAYLSFAQENPSLFRLMFGAEAAKGLRATRRRSEHEGRLLDARRRTQRVIVRAVKAYREHGAQIPMSAEKAGLAAWTMFHGAATLLIDGQFPLVGLDIARASSLMLDLLVSHRPTDRAEAAEALATGKAAEAESTASAEPRAPSSAPTPAREARKRGTRTAEPAPVGREPAPESSAKPSKTAPEGPTKAARESPAEPARESPARPVGGSSTKAAPRSPARPAPASSTAEGPTPAPPSSEPASLEPLFDAQGHLRRNTDVLRHAAVLWIDDRPELSRAEEALLRRLHAELHRVMDTEEALAYAGLGAMPIDLIISDIGRPRSHRAGLEDLPKVREAFPDSPVIFYVRSTEGRGGVPEGAAGLTSSPEELLHLILDVLERKRA